MSRCYRLGLADLKLLLHPSAAVVIVRDGAAGRNELVTCSREIRGKRHAHDRQNFIELLHRARSENRRRDSRLILYPQHRELRRRDTGVVRERR